jgi:hypothetical protein
MLSQIEGEKKRAADTGNGENITAKGIEKRTRARRN